MSFVDYFIGSSQSKYSAVAIVSAIFAICAVILFINDDISLGTRIGIILTILFFSIIPVGISLFNLTCMVTGDKNGKYNPCGIWAWVTAIIIIINCFILIISAVLSVSTYKKAYNKVVVTETFKLKKEDENKIAENIIKEEGGEIPSPVAPQVVEPVVEQPVAPLQQEKKKDASLIVGFDDQSNNYASL